MKIVNVMADEVFQKLAAGLSVYAVDVKDDILVNLFYETVNEVHDYITGSRYGFFIAESEELNND